MTDFPTTFVLFADDEPNPQKRRFLGVFSSADKAQAAALTAGFQNPLIVEWPVDRSPPSRVATGEKCWRVVTDGQNVFSIFQMPVECHFDGDFDKTMDGYKFQDRNGKWLIEFYVWAKSEREAIRLGEAWGKANVGCADVAGPVYGGFDRS